MNTRNFWVATLASALAAGCGKTEGGQANAAVEHHRNEALQPAAPASPPKQDAFDPRVHAMLANVLALDLFRLLTGHPAAPADLFPAALLPLPVGADFLHSQAVSNIAALDKDLANKRVLISEALVISITSGPRPGWYTLELPGGVAVFERDADYVAKLSAGRVARMVCTYQPGTGYPGFVLVGCRGLASEVETMAGMAALTPGMLGPAGEAIVRKMKARITRDVMRKAPQCTAKVSLSECFGDYEGLPPPQQDTAPAD